MLISYLLLLLSIVTIVLLVIILKIFRRGNKNRNTSRQRNDASIASDTLLTSDNISISIPVKPLSRRRNYATTTPLNSNYYLPNDEIREEGVYDGNGDDDFESSDNLSVDDEGLVHSNVINATSSLPIVPGSINLFLRRFNMRRFMSFAYNELINAYKEYNYLQRWMKKSSGTVVVVVEGDDEESHRHSKYNKTFPLQTTTNRSINDNGPVVHTLNDTCETMQNNNENCTVLATTLSNINGSGDKEEEDGIIPKHQHLTLTEMNHVTTLIKSYLKHSISRFLITCKERSYYGNNSSFVYLGDCVKELLIGNMSTLSALTPTVEPVTTSTKIVVRPSLLMKDMAIESFNSNFTFRDVTAPTSHSRKPIINEQANASFVSFIPSVDINKLARVSYHTIIFDKVNKCKCVSIDSNPMFMCLEIPMDVINSSTCFDEMIEDNDDDDSSDHYYCLSIIMPMDRIGFCNLTRDIISSIVLQWDKMFPTVRTIYSNDNTLMKVNLPCFSLDTRITGLVLKEATTNISSKSLPTLNVTNVDDAINIVESIFNIESCSKNHNTEEDDDNNEEYNNNKNFQHTSDFSFDFFSSKSDNKVIEVTDSNTCSSHSKNNIVINVNNAFHFALMKRRKTTTTAIGAVIQERIDYGIHKVFIEQILPTYLPIYVGNVTKV